MLLLEGWIFSLVSLRLFFQKEPRKPSEAVPSMEVLPSFQPPPMDRIQQAMIRVPGCWNSRWLVGTGFPCGETPFERETVSSSPTEQRHVPLAAAPWLPGALCATTVAARGSERVHVPSDDCRQAADSTTRSISGVSGVIRLCVTTWSLKSW